MAWTWNAAVNGLRVSAGQPALRNGRVLATPREYANVNGVKGMRSGAGQARIDHVCGGRNGRSNYTHVHLMDRCQERTPK